VEGVVEWRESWSGGSRGVEGVVEWRKPPRALISVPLIPISAFWSLLPVGICRVILAPLVLFLWETGPG
jgi:hypothetical protein